VRRLLQCLCGPNEIDGLARLPTCLIACSFVCCFTYDNLIRSIMNSRIVNRQFRESPKTHKTDSRCRVEVEVRFELSEAAPELFASCCSYHSLRTSLNFSWRRLWPPGAISRHSSCGQRRLQFSQLSSSRLDFGVHYGPLMHIHICIYEYTHSQL